MIGEKIMEYGDLISRQSAIDAVISLCDDCDSGYCGSCRVNYPGEKDARKVLEDLPSAQPNVTGINSGDIISREMVIDRSPGHGHRCIKTKGDLR